MIIRYALLAASLATLTACSETETSEIVDTNGRWYTPAQVIEGKDVFSIHCASCHGNKAQSLVTDWKQPLPDGKYPPPPLNGSAHAWHHPKAQLLRSINNGGVPLGGTMPPFANKLTDDEKLAAIAYFQNFWTDKIYTTWEQRDKELSQ